MRRVFDGHVQSLSEVFVRLALVNHGVVSWQYMGCGRIEVECEVAGQGVEVRVRLLHVG